MEREILLSQSVYFVQKTGEREKKLQNEKYDEAKVSERLRDHSWFIAFAPLDNPKIALAVIVENGGFGARAAAPIARTMLDYFLLGKIPKSMEAPEDDAVEQEGKESD